MRSKQQTVVIVKAHQLYASRFSALRRYIVVRYQSHTVLRNRQNISSRFSRAVVHLRRSYEFYGSNSVVFVLESHCRSQRFFIKSEFFEVDVFCHTHTGNYEHLLVFDFFFVENLHEYVVAIHFSELIYAHTSRLPLILAECRYGECNRIALYGYAKQHTFAVRLYDFL